MQGASISGLHGHVLIMHNGLRSYYGPLVMWCERLSKIWVIASAG
jgi:hypothetical protein